MILNSEFVQSCNHVAECAVSYISRCLFLHLPFIHVVPRLVFRAVACCSWLVGSHEEKCGAFRYHTIKSFGLRKISKCLSNISIYPMTRLAPPRDVVVAEVKKSRKGRQRWGEQSMKSLKATKGFTREESVNCSGQLLSGDAYRDSFRQIPGVIDMAVEICTGFRHWGRDTGCGRGAGIGILD